MRFDSRANPGEPLTPLATTDAQPWSSGGSETVSHPRGTKSGAGALRYHGREPSVRGVPHA